MRRHLLAPLQFHSDEDFYKTPFLLLNPIFTRSHWLLVYAPSSAPAVKLSYQSDKQMLRRHLENAVTENASPKIREHAKKLLEKLSL